MLTWIYVQPPALWALLLAIAVCLWPLLGLCIDRRFQKPRLWPAINGVLWLLCVYVILYTALIRRTPGTFEPILTPFYSFVAARTQPEWYRTVLMNVYVFVPLGMSLSAALGKKLPLWLRMLLTVLCGFALSATVEYTQYFRQLGLPEIDDVIFNSLGTFLGACQCLLTPVWLRLCPHRKHPPS